jgi:metal-dependent amidase/aminoacylase/carboxypeptidase family protein
MRAREMNPIERLVIGVGAIHGGQTNNIVCDHVEMNVSIRTQDTALSEHIYKRITQIAESVAADMGGSAKLETYKFSPALHNDLDVIDGIQAAAEKIIGAQNILVKPESMGGEDFAFLSRVKPSMQFMLGVKTPGAEKAYPVHNGRFNPNEDSMAVGIEVFLQFVLDNMHGIDLKEVKL